MSEDAKRTGTETGRRPVLRWTAEVLMLWLLWALAALLPVDAASRAGRRIMSLIGPRTAKHRHVLANLRMVCPHCEQRQIERSGIEVWGNIGAVFAEFTKLPLLTDAQRNRDRFELVYREGAAEACARPCVYVAAHLANWEMIGYATSRAAGTIDVIYNPQPNPLLERTVQKRRRVLGCGYVGKVNSVRRLYGLLESGRSVGLMVDVRVDGAPALPFCGAPATTTTTPAWLSLRTGCDIVPVQIERIRDARFRVTLHSPLRARRQDGETREQALLRVSGDINALIGQWIAARPGEWLCTKRRWPKDIMKQRGAYPA